MQKLRDSLPRDARGTRNLVVRGTRFSSRKYRGQHVLLGFLGASLSVGVVTGAQLGARISLRLRGAVIQWLLAAALLVLAARLLLTA